MKRNSSEHLKPCDRNVVPLRTGQRMYYVTAVAMVPHEYVIAVPADSPEAACQLANDVVNHGKIYGVPNFGLRERLGVQGITSAGPNDRGDATKFEPIPEKYRHKRAVAGVTL